MPRRVILLMGAITALALPTPALAAEVAPGVQWTPIVRQTGPERINVLELDPPLVHGVLSNGRVAGRERVSTMARRVGAVAGVNGGFFGPSGDPVGVLAIDGELLSEPVEGRSAVLLPAPGAAAPALTSSLIAPVRYRGRITVNGRSREIDGIDRTRGLIPACGGRGGDVPTIRPNPVLTCTDSSELVVLSPLYGMRPPAEGGVEAIVRNGTVTSVRPPGIGGVPGDGLLLTGTGDAAAFLRNAALPRSRAEIALQLIAGDRQFLLAPGGRAPAGSAAGGTPDSSAAGATVPEATPAVVVG